MSERVLVTGGAGYIGSHVARALAEAGHAVTVLDDLSTGHRDSVGALALIECALEDEGALERALAAVRPAAIVHLAGRIDIAESVAHPQRYVESIEGNSRRLLEAAARHGVKRFVYSSSAAVYRASLAPLAEGDALGPANPYGESKARAEAMLPGYERGHGLAWVALRYFNAAGAHPDGTLGERHDPETHLIPLALRAASGRLARLAVHGTDWPTADGTCVRDYVHVCDLADGHVAALAYLARSRPSRAFNLGGGRGTSVREVVDAVQRTTARKVPLAEGPRRAGDPPVLVADIAAARAQLDWSPRLSALDTIVEHAWRWERSLASLAA